MAAGENATPAAARARLRRSYRRALLTAWTASMANVYAATAAHRSNANLPCTCLLISRPQNPLQPLARRCSYHAHSVLAKILSRYSCCYLSCR